MKIEITARSIQFIDKTENILAEAKRKLLQRFTIEQKNAFLELLIKAYENIGTGNRA